MAAAGQAIWAGSQTSDCWATRQALCQRGWLPVLTAASRRLGTDSDGSRKEMPADGAVGLDSASRRGCGGVKPGHTVMSGTWARHDEASPARGRWCRAADSEVIEDPAPEEDR
jgi:hypothetical protein